MLNRFRIKCGLPSLSDDAQGCEFSRARNALDCHQPSARRTGANVDGTSYLPVLQQRDAQISLRDHLRSLFCNIRLSRMLLRLAHLIR